MVAAYGLPGQLASQHRQIERMDAAVGQPSQPRRR